MTSGQSIGDRALVLAQRGKVAEALTLLNQGATRNDPAALFELGVWRLSGTWVPRDLVIARAFFCRAGDAGHVDGAEIYNAFLANGTGGAANWGAAIDLLQRRAVSDANAATQMAIIGTMQLKPDGDPIKTPVSRLLSESPFVALITEAFTKAECRFLSDAAEPLMQPALTIDPQTGQLLQNPIRTSDGAGFPLAEETPAIHAFNRRIAALSGLPVNHGEPLQVLRYRPGQQYRPHIDALPHTDNQRVATVLVYLNSGYDGGETLFMSNGLSVRGEIGDALLFRNVTSNGRPDPRAQHAGLPVRHGVKLIASRWIRAKPLSLAGPIISD